jgi:hypothetical protein
MKLTGQLVKPDNKSTDRLRCTLRTQSRFVRREKPRVQNTIPLIDTWERGMTQDPVTNEMGKEANSPNGLHTTPKPAMTRPTMNVAHLVSSWRPTPRQKTRQDMIRPHLRPTISPIGNAKRAPKKVPAERIET